MSFSAQDYALILTTLTTAITALSGIVLPYLSAHKSATRARNLVVQDNFGKLSDELLVAAQERKDSQRNVLFELQKAKLAVEVGSKYEMKTLPDTFDLAKLKFNFFAKRHGIDSRKLSDTLTVQTIVFQTYWTAVIDRRQDAPTVLAECIEHDARLEKEVLELAELVFSDLRRLYPS